MALPRPSDISGLQLWLPRPKPVFVTKDGSNRVSQWNDISGNDRHFTTAAVASATNPLWLPDAADGRPGISFSALARTDALGRAETIIDWSVDATVIVVARPGNHTGQFSGNSTIMQWNGVAGATRNLIWFNSGAYTRTNFSNNAGTESELFHVAWPGLPQPFALRRTGNTLRALSGKELTLQVSVAAPANPLAYNRVKLGQVTGVGCYSIISEVCMWDRYLSDAELFSLYPWFCNADPTAPVIGDPSVPEGEILSNQPISFLITENDTGDNTAPGLRRVTVYAVFDDAQRELVFDGINYDGLSVPYQIAGSDVTFNISGGQVELDVFIVRQGSWPTENLKLEIKAIDALGNETARTLEYTILNPPLEPDVVAPQVALVAPAADTAIAATQPITLDVTDNQGFRRVLIAVHNATTGVWELVHDGDNFVGHYSVSSSRSVISGGYRYTMLRHGGWLGNPTFKVWAIDQAGNEV